MSGPEYPTAEKWDRFRQGAATRTRAECATDYDKLLVMQGSGAQPHPMIDYGPVEDEGEGP